MSGYAGNGTFSFTYNWVNDANNAIAITASRMDTQFADATGGFNNVICRDGQSTTTASIPFALGASFDAAITYGGVTLANSVTGTGSMVLGADGTFTPTDQSGAGLVFTVQRAAYTRIGTRYLVDMELTYPATADGTASKIGLGALPVFANVTGVGGAFALYDGIASHLGFPNPGANTFNIANAAGVNVTNASLSTSVIRAQFQLATV